jgi:hypothetical protein
MMTITIALADGDGRTELLAVHEGLPAGVSVGSGEGDGLPRDPATNQ